MGLRLFFVFHAENIPLEKSISKTRSVFEAPHDFRRRHRIQHRKSHILVSKRQNLTEFQTFPKYIHNTFKILQKYFFIETNDNEKTLKHKTQKIEHKAFPEAIINIFRNT